VAVILFAGRANAETLTEQVDATDSRDQRTTPEQQEPEAQPQDDHKSHIMRKLSDTYHNGDLASVRYGGINAAVSALIREDITKDSAVRSSWRHMPGDCTLAQIMHPVLLEFVNQSPPRHLNMATDNILTATWMRIIIDAFVDASNERSIAGVETYLLAINKPYYETVTIRGRHTDGIEIIPTCDPAGAETIDIADDLFPCHPRTSTHIRAGDRVIATIPNGKYISGSIVCVECSGEEVPCAPAPEVSAVRVRLDTPIMITTGDRCDILTVDPNHIYEMWRASTTETSMRDRCLPQHRVESSVMAFLTQRATISHAKGHVKRGLTPIDADCRLHAILERGADAARDTDICLSLEEQNVLQIILNPALRDDVPFAALIREQARMDAENQAAAQDPATLSATNTHSHECE
jgi:hypothetical protein